MANQRNSNIQCYFLLQIYQPINLRYKNQVAYLQNLRNQIKLYKSNIIDYLEVYRKQKQEQERMINRINISMNENQIHESRLHEHFPNLSPFNFKLYQAQRNINLTLEERYNAYKKELEDAKMALNRQILAFNNLSSKLHSQDVIVKMKESHEYLQIATDENQKQKTQQNLLNIRRQIDEVQEECEQIESITTMSKLEHEDLSKELLHLQKISERKKENLQKLYQKNKNLQQELDEIHHEINQAQILKNQEKAQYNQMIVQLMNNGISVTQNQNYMVQNSILNELFYSLNKEVHQYKKQIKNGEMSFNNLVVNGKKLTEQRDKYLQINILKQKLGILKNKNKEFEENLQTLKKENKRLKDSFQEEIFKQSQISRQQLQKDKITELKAYKGVGLRLISLCNSLNMTDIAEEFMQRHQQIQNQSNLQ